jgi:hypothetical protein
MTFCGGFEGELGGRVGSTGGSITDGYYIFVLCREYEMQVVATALAIISLVNDRNNLKRPF